MRARIRRARRSPRLHPIRLDMFVQQLEALGQAVDQQTASSMRSRTRWVIGDALRHSQPTQSSRPTPWSGCAVAIKASDTSPLAELQASHRQGRHSVGGPRSCAKQHRIGARSSRACASRSARYVRATSAASATRAASLPCTRALQGCRSPSRARRVRPHRSISQLASNPSCR
jgi:hypothetical protein